MNLSSPFVRRPIATVLLTAGVALAAPEVPPLLEGPDDPTLIGFDPDAPRPTPGGAR